MAATVGATLTFVAFPDRHAGLGPFKSSTGAYYFVGRSTALAGQITIPGTTDPMGGTWAPPAADKTMSSSTSTSIQAAAAYQVGDVLHIVTQISTGAVYYNTYNISTDTWGLATSEVAVAAASFAPVTGWTFVDLVVRSNGNVVIGYNAGQTAMSSAFNMVRYRERTATNTYGTATNVDNGGSVNWLGPIVELGASGRVHFFFVRDTATAAAYQRTLSAANSLQAFPSAIVTDANGVLVFAPGVSYDDAGTQKVRVPFGLVTAGITNLGQLAKLDSADTPTVTTDSNIGDTALKITSGHRVHTLANDGTTLHYLYAASSDSDLRHDSSTGGGGAWGTDTNEFTGTVNHITPNVFDRSGTKLAMVLDDGGAIKYAEIALAAAAVNVTMDPATLASLGRSAAVTPGAVSRLMGAAVLASLGRNLTLNTPLTLALDSAALASLGRALTVTPGAASFAMDPAALALLGRSLTLDTPLTLALDASALALAPQALSVTPGAVSIAQDVATLASLGQPATITPGAASVALNAALLASAGYPLTIDQATTIALQSAVLASLGQAATIIPGAATLPLDAAALGGSGWPLTLSMGATTSQMTTAILASTGHPLITGADILIGMQIASLVAEGRTLTSAMGGVSLPMDAAALTVLGRGLVVVPGAASASMDAAALTSLGRVLSVVPGSVSTGMDASALIAGPRALTVVPGEATLGMDLASPVAVGRGLVVVPGAASVVLDAALLALAGQSAIIDISGGAQSIAMALAALANLGQPLTVVPGAATSQMDSVSLTVAGQQASVVPGAVTVSTDAASLVLAPQDLTVETLTSVAMDTAALSASGRTLTVIPGNATVLLDAYTAALEGLGLQVMIFAQETPSGRVFIVLAENRFSRPVREMRAMDVATRREALIVASDNRLLATAAEDRIFVVND